MEVYIIYRNFLNKDKKTLSIGGIQTYILNLCDVIRKLQFKPVICQSSTEDFETEYDGMKVYGYISDDNSLAKIAITKLNLHDEPIIFGSHELFVKYHGPSIGIQHGISWDTPVHQELTKGLNIAYTFQRARMAYLLLKKVSLVNQLVCVDYNFINWYRTQVAYPSMRMTTIPNFAIPQTNIAKPKDRVNLIFARRLFWYRGTRMFMDIMEELLDENPSLYITVAGEGADENMFNAKYGEHKRVSLIRYNADESYQVHSDKHIAIIPTLGSEGTSLSLLEAMASQCAVICTNVGGMSNIVLNRYNGLIINPEKRALKEAITLLVNNPALRVSLADKGLETIQHAFNLNVWKDGWERVIRQEFIERRE